MVNGNYALYADRPLSESEMVDDHVHASPERKCKRKIKMASDRNTANLENETDSVKNEKKVKEPRLLRYIPNSDIEENYVNNKYETYDMKLAEEPQRRYSFAKKPKNPADGSVNYAYSRSSSNCSSPSGNLPTISELGEQSFGTYRVRPPPSPSVSEIINAYDTKYDKYFTDSKHTGFKSKGSHPDSLYRVPTSSADIAAGKLLRCMRLLRWPAALVTICIALTVFVYFLIPSNMEPTEARNGTLWVAGVPEAQSNNRLLEEKDKLNYKEQTPKHTNAHGPIKTSEIDFYGADNEKPIDVTDVHEKIASTSPKRILPVPPVFPSHISLEVQYGNEEADSDKIRTGKTFEEANILPDDSTLKPHITQKPERPLEINIKNVDTIAPTERVLQNAVETVTTAETAVNISNYEKMADKTNEFHSTGKKELIINEDPNKKETIANFEEISKTPAETQKFGSDHNPINTKVDGEKFTSGHSKFFGVSIEDVAMIKSTTQSSAYKTRVSPTLPTWRDRDGTTKNYPINLNSDVTECDSTRVPLCRGVLPYDLAGPPASFNGIPITTYLPQIEYLIASNCSSRLIHFVCSLLEPECNAPGFPPVLPCYNLCRAITDSCENYIPRELATMFNCNGYASANCLSAKGPCYQRELSCRDGSCVPRDWMCDGTNDCPGGEDEATCVICEPQEFRCQSGACILKQWLCDGYIDCEDGSDESIETCAGRGVRGSPSAVPRIADEETAGSAPAPSVRRPNRLPGNSRASDHAAGENESSKELLITSDSNNALKRNFTRRPPLSRLTPYSRANLQNKYSGVLENTEIESMKVDQEPSKTRDTEKPKGGDDMTFFGDLAKEAAEIQSLNNKQVIVEDRKPDKQVIGRAPEPGNIKATRIDKTFNKVDRVIDSASMIRITEPPMPPEEYEEYPQRTSGHVSPCPSGELRCVDGRCITLAQLCDGTIDCSDHADEDNCYT